VGISNCFGIGYSANSFTVATPPTLSQATPAAANPGATVSLSGSGLSAITRATFNGVAAASFTAINDSTLTAAVPYGAGSGPITVTGPAGAASIPFTVLPPAIASVSPAAAVAPGTGISINGQGFLDATGVSIGGVATGCSIISGTQLTATVPAGLRPTSAIGVTVSSPEGTSALFPISVTVPAPVCSGQAPASGQPGTLVTITGQYFTHASAVSFNAVPASFTFISDTCVTALVPASASTGPVAVTTCYGTGRSAAAFTVLQPVQAVVIGQAPDNLLVGTSYSFTASLAGLSGGVTWTVQEGIAGGSIDASGNYTAPATPGTYHVLATSTAVPAISASVAVPVHDALLDGEPHATAQPCVTDLAYFMAAMGSKTGDPNYNPLADLNGDGVIDDADLALFLSAF
jgi:hypothetical protein